MTRHSVTIDDPPSMNLLGLILASILERNLADPARQRGAARLRGDVVVQAGEMVVTLSFAEGGVTVRRGAAEHPRAAVRGSLDTLMGLSLGRGMVGPVLAGRLKPRGSLLQLWRIRRLLQVE